MRRFVAAAAALILLTAFAPAPFPRPTRRGPAGVSLQGFQGDWKVVSMDTVSKAGQPVRINGLWFNGVRVRDDVWTYLSGASANSSYRIAIDPTKSPTTLDFYNATGPKDRPVMVGLIRRDGADRVEILYYAATPENRARAFAAPPPDWWVLVLRRDR